MPAKLSFKIADVRHVEVISAIDGTVVRFVPADESEGVNIAVAGHPSVAFTELRPWLQPQPPAPEEDACPVRPN